MHLTGCASWGNAGNITAYWMGFCQYHGAGLCDRSAAHDGLKQLGQPLITGQPVAYPDTVATAIPHW